MQKQSSNEIRVCIDIGSQNHYVAIGLSTGEHLDEFPLHHNQKNIEQFFDKIKELELKHNMPVVFAMEGYNGYARPIDKFVLKHGYKLFNVNNTKLARFKEIFPGAAKSDPIDAWKIFDLFKMKDNLPLAKNALQEVLEIDEVNEQLKKITRRRRDLVVEKNRISNRLQADLEAVCPGILSITKSIDNIWFLSFLTLKDQITKLLRIKRSSILKIKGVGAKYADLIEEWQKSAKFSPSSNWVGQMIIQDASRILQLQKEIKKLEDIIEESIPKSKIASRISTIPGFGLVCTSELAGEIGNLDRFASEASLAIYIGMGVLDNKSGKYEGTKNPRNINTRAKGAMMTAVARHVEYNEEAKKYYDKKRNEGKKHNQAIRSLGRHLTRVIWSMLKQERDYYVKNKLAENIESGDKKLKFDEFAEVRSTATCSWFIQEMKQEDTSEEKFAASLR